MIESAQEEVQSIGKLLLTPTPENFEAVNRKLERLASLLESCKADLSAGKSPDSRLREFIGGLPAEMDRVRTLMQAPMSFLSGLNVFLAAKFGSYDQAGQMKKFDAAAPVRTLAHL